MAGSVLLISGMAVSSLLARLLSCWRLDGRMRRSKELDALRVVLSEYLRFALLDQDVESFQ